VPIILFAFRKRIAKFYSRFESRFLGNLNAKELEEVKSMARMPQLAPWDAVLVQMVMSPDSKIAGYSLEESQFRSKTGATVAMIDRGHRRIFAPTRDQRLLPGDELFLIGTDEQLAAAQQLIQAEAPQAHQDHDELFNLESFTVEPNSRYAHQSIRSIGVGDEFGGLIVGIERGTTRILNPISSVVLEPGDLIWVFGKRDRIKELRAACKSTTVASEAL
jgi:CPA2 family monovalent cation:H+ antiporter-2